MISEYTHEKTGIKLMRIEGGTFLMASLEDEEESCDDDRPQRQVTLSTFCLGKFPVTGEQYARFFAATPAAHKPQYWEEPGYNQVNQPVVGVSWEDAMAYAAWAGL